MNILELIGLATVLVVVVAAAGCALGIVKIERIKE